MSELHIKTNPKVASVYHNYSDFVREKITHLRNLIIETAEEIEEITSIEETLKWGEPSFLTKKGSTIRIDWKKSKPDQYGMYFQCTSKLVTTFRVIYKDTFQFEGNRAIIFPIQEDIPKKELQNCIRAALTYHTVKHLPTLGI
ncbi:DUF1801 domain-containing protein [Aquimarina sp. 2201CG14-23]|uniref:DUF1801 domain-containing protein n=1 Tax=Aquimarina mycalae TaxID=3040073 RepID=UPI002477F72A|nr:DUF1801 domain-containing protein [Aquimarina sp. 2201CG14-23]MDH7445873.1 DUF1801 domain-containing protein [Aquimarina sp. 2201CG14-23]